MTLQLWADTINKNKNYNSFNEDVSNESKEFLNEITKADLVGKKLKKTPKKVSKKPDDSNIQENDS